MSGKNISGTNAAEKVGTLFSRFNPGLMEKTFHGSVVLKNRFDKQNKYKLRFWICVDVFRKLSKLPQSKIQLLH